MIEGIWIPVAAEMNGQPLPAAMLNGMSLVIQGNSYSVTVGGSVDKGNITTNNSTSPPSMTISGTDGPNKGKTIPAIFELTSDELKICYGLNGIGIPQEFSSKGSPNLFMVVYQRKHS